MRYQRNPREPGQILVLFVLALVAMFAMAALLFDGGQALALRRQLQDASDAAAIAASNVIQSGTPKGCSATPGPPPGSPRAAVVTAAQDAVHANLPNFPTANITVTCVSDAKWNNWAVEVDLSGRSSGYFGGVVGMSGFDVRTTSQAVNGQVAGIKYSVVELDPSNLGWATGYKGCPSVDFAGSNNIQFDGSLQVDSTCSSANGGALSQSGAAAVVAFNNGAVASLVGGCNTKCITPAPLTGQPNVKDPLLNIDAIPYTSWMSTWPSGTCTVGTAYNTQGCSQTTLSGGQRVLEPGLYRGGIQMKNSASAYLHPGIYVMLDASNGDGGFQIGAQNKVYSIPASMCTASSTSCTVTDSSWATDCATSNCGVVIYNVGMACASGSPKDQISVGAGATLKLRPYLSTADGTGTNDSDFNNLLIWQDKSPTPAGPPNTACNQPAISLSGGGAISISGTLYAPSALVQMGGTSGGSGGSELDVTLQFISWDLTFSGNIGFHFYYQSNAFATPKDYGLIK
jgi:hypothetical protein